MAAIAAATSNVVTTQILPCDPTSISFSQKTDDADVQPTITSEITLASLQTAVDDLNTLSVPVVMPTETVYGLAAPALVPSAVLQIFSIKGRPSDNPLIVHVSSLGMLRSLLPPTFTMPPAYNALIKAFWPGALTLLFPTSSQIPSIITAGHPTVAIRMPSHPVARALIALANAPLAAPSANTSGSPSHTKAEHSLRNLNGKLRTILDGGPCEVGLESTVLDGLQEDGKLRVLRPGGVTVEDMESVLANAGLETVPEILVHRRDYTDTKLEDAPTTPGMKYRHYSPAVPVVLFMTSPISSSSDTAGNNPTRMTVPEALSRILSSFPPSPYKPVKIGLLTPSDSPLSLLPSQYPSFPAPSASSPPPDSDPPTPISWHTFPLGQLSNPSLTAQRLFDGLLTLEEEGVDLIVVEGVDEKREGLAVMNRVKKAAGEVVWVAV
ncbi:hypothetical protein M422DRAFT_149864 [Sphaerobolus stellatus SS14]|nr:hypothetical protein M422DRAFT_149864 [Sphaerobolus stellatus SS14]